MAFEIYMLGKSRFSSNRREALDLASKSSFGEIKDGKVIYSIYEVLYLMEKKKSKLLNLKNKEIKFNGLIKKADSLLYSAFRDLKNKGYILKEGLKFGSDFRVYLPGQMPGKAHAKYLLYVLNGSARIKPSDFTSKARIAHSTNTLLLLAIVDSEEDISYYEVGWKSKD